MEKTICELFAGVGGFRCGFNNINTVEDTKKEEYSFLIGRSIRLALTESEMYKYIVDSFEPYFDKKEYEYPTRTINLIALNCTMVGDSYEVLEHEEIAWITKEEFKNYEFAPADIYFVEKITNES